MCSPVEIFAATRNYFGQYRFLCYNFFGTMSRRIAKSGRTTRAVIGEPLLLTSLTNRSNGRHIERPHRINPETSEEREKRLKKRKALTLKVFKVAFDNNHTKA
jgi:hypothetical protein